MYVQENISHKPDLEALNTNETLIWLHFKSSSFCLQGATKHHDDVSPTPLLFFLFLFNQSILNPALKPG